MKLTEYEIAMIFITEEPTRVLAAKYKVSTHTIRNIKRRRVHTDVTGQYSLFPKSKRQGNRHILPDEDVLYIYRYAGSLSRLKLKYGISKRVAMNIKFRHTYVGVTENEGPPGELRVHKLTWDDVCSIRGSLLESSVLAELFGVTKSTINNIRAGRTRKLK